VILRLRHVMDGPDNSTLKLRRAVADRLTGPWRAGSVHEADYRLEYDWGLRRVLAASLERRVNSDQIEDIVAGRRPLGDAFSGEQEALLGEGGPGLADPFDDLDVAGPITALQWRDLEVNGFRGGSALRAERWDYDGRSFIELSVRVKDAGKASERRARLVVLLEQRRLIPDQDARSEAALRDLLS
jgi:hypothetical protein